jgi:3-phenylpropionate/trans-cinnamate dioxygenase ferredoxin subunit
MSTTHRIALALSDLPEGQMHACSAGGRDIVVCRTKEGVFAVDNICTHAYARLNEGRLRGFRLICPLHGAAFDVRDGRPLGAPASRPLATHSLTIVDDRIEIEVDAAQPESR